MIRSGLVLVVCVSLASPDPLLVQLVCRHGDRSPYEYYPNYAHRDFWPQGLGALTPTGMRQHFHNGVLLRQRYPHLDQVFQFDNFKVVSSSRERCIESAESFLAGAFPPVGEFNFEPGLNWQPIPLHTIPAEEDMILNQAECPAKAERRAEILNSEESREALAPHREFINEVCENAGYPSDQWDVDCIEVVNDDLFCDSVHNLTLPEWATPDVIQRVRDVNNLRNMFRYGDPLHNYLDAGGGPLLDRMMKDMKKKIEGELREEFIFYSAHDTTIMPFLGQFGFPVAAIPLTPRVFYCSCSRGGITGCRSPSRIRPSARISLLW